MSFMKYALAMTAMVLIAGCGGGDQEQASKESAGNASGDKSALGELTRQAMAGLSLESEGAWVQDMIEGAGYEVIYYESFPGQPNGKKGRIVLYGAKNSGGIIYLAKSPTTVAPVWHWHFDDMKPDSVSAVELNDDGLWDVRLVASGSVYRFIQGESFTLMAKERGDWLALNGESSPPVSLSESMWYCFDGDTRTSWQSQGMSGKPAFLEVTSPFGLEVGEMTIDSESDAPRSVMVIADGKEVQTLPLQSGKHIVQLDPAVKGAKNLRLVFERDAGASSVAITELSIR